MRSTKASTGMTDLKNRLLFLLAALMVYRIGTHIPVPGLDSDQITRLFEGTTNFFSLFNHFSGGALSRLSIFSIGVMPYISASIIIQLLTSVWEPLKQLKKEGHVGRKKISQYTRYLTIALGAFQAFGMARYLAMTGVAYDPSPIYYFTTTLTFVTGTMFLMWLGEQITERGIGNGISLIIFASIVSSLPNSILGTLEKVRQGEIQGLVFLMLCVLFLSVIAVIVFIERGQRRIPVQYAKRQQGRQVFAAQESHLPLKLNMAGVIPPIFASALILFPATIGQWFGSADPESAGFFGKLFISMGTVLTPGHPLYIALFGLAIVFFCFFYTGLVFNPKETADNLKKSGAFIAGIRPGDKTADYIDQILTRLTLFGAVYIVTISLLPEFLVYGWNIPIYFGGTSLLIVVVVMMDFIAQIQSHVISYQYEGLLKKSKTNLRLF